MNIVDEDLKNEVSVSREKRSNRQTADEEISFLGYEKTQSTADWLVTKFCRMCPHREA